MMTTGSGALRPEPVGIFLCFLIEYCPLQGCGPLLIPMPVLHHPCMHVYDTAQACGAGAQSPHSLSGVHLTVGQSVEISLDGMGD